jgi:hypothetical protein
MAAAVPNALAIDYGGVNGPDWYAGVAARIVAQMDAEPWIAVLHSGAGGFAPALAAAAGRLAGLIFIDAVLPDPGRRWRDTAPALADRLAGLTCDGLLPPWNRWFGEDPIPKLLPDTAIREAFLADLPRVPFAFLEAVSPNLREWEALPIAYLQLSGGYDAESAAAERRGWPVRRAALHHLAMVSDPDKVAALLIDLPMSPPAA